MAAIYNDPQHWRDRANEARSLADKMTEIDSQARMVGVAEEYERIAARAHQRLKAGALATAPVHGLVECGVRANE
jgi:hypothetical protein